LTGPANPVTPGRNPVSFTSMRRAIARRMTESKASAPHFYANVDIEMDALRELVGTVNAARTPTARITLTAYLLRAVVLALVDHPAFNAEWNDDVLEQWDDINPCIAIALDVGLVAPALLDCRHRGPEDLAADLEDLVERARAGKLKAREVSEGTFTLSNLGMYDVSAFTAIITPPQVAILATARIEPRAVVRADDVVVRRMMTAILSSDHRVVDGAEAARFLGTYKSLLEAPKDWAMV
jgi:pyruvate dehydrogenase E2 component (dihydrolipoamide acetyltransferase)